MSSTEPRSRPAAPPSPPWRALLRRAPRSLANRILLLQLSWAIAVFLMVSAGLWWGTAHIIEESLQRQAAGWLARADELGTPLYAAEEATASRTLHDYLSNIPELLSVHYFDASGRQLVYGYWRDDVDARHIPWPSEEELSQLQPDAAGEKPLLFGADDRGASFRVSAPIWIKSLQRDGLLDFSLDGARPEVVQTIGYIRMRLDYGRFNSEFARNALRLSGAIALLLGIFLLLGRVLIRWALRPLTSLEVPLARLARGETDVQVTSSGDREIAQIGRALNTTIGALRERDEALRRLASRDPLTGLANRGYFDEALREEVAVIARQGGSSALLFIDLDRFKQINDSYGHSAGDRLLVQVAERLRGRLRECDLIARFGGDEFTVLVRGVSRQGASEIAAALIELMQGLQFHQGGESLRIQFSIGVALIDGTARNADEVLHHADAAASEAKRRGRNRFQFYEGEAAVPETQGWRQRLRECLAAEALLLHFQPVFDLASGQVISHEVLLRLPDAEDGTVAPAAFLADAERYGLMGEIDRQVVSKALRLMAADGDDAAPLSINLSLQSLEDEGFPEFVAQQLRCHGVAPQRLLFEVPERMLHRNFEGVRDQITALVALGVAVVIDDFGAGFASPSYLRHCTAAWLKLDGHMVSNLKDDKLDQIALRAIAEMAAERNIRTVAKFIPDAATITLLEALGIDAVQGSFTAPPASERVVASGQPELPDAVSH